MKCNENLSERNSLPEVHRTPSDGKPIPL